MLLIIQAAGGSRILLFSLKFEILKILTEFAEKKGSV